MRRDAVVAAARGWIGTPYQHQASCRGAGADCLGLVRGLWRELIGAEPAPVPGYSPDWAEASGEERLWSAARAWLVPRQGLAPGAVVLFRMRRDGVAKHMGIVSALGDRPAFVHAYSGHRVTESPLALPWARRIVAAFDFPGVS
jgi:NlpC/P60 family putative phage cell wall peptidase